MRRALVLCVLALSFLLASAAVCAPAGGRRVALVVGNSAYKSVSPLTNPANDARLMAETLKSLGFELVGGRAMTDVLGKAELEQAVQRFGEMVKGAQVGLFFYAGHGVQVDGRNYLVPVAANVSGKTQIKYQLLDVDYVLDEMGAAGTQVNVVVLDACRNNPFGDRGLRDVGSGLAQIMAPKGTLVAYSTAPGRTAADGAGKNSPFTEALARQIKTPGLRLDDVFMRTGAEVEQKTGGDQSPWKSDNLRGVLCLAGDCAGAPPQPGGGQATAQAAALESRIAELQKQLADKGAGKAQAERIALLQKELEDKSAQLAKAQAGPPAVAPGAGQEQFVRQDPGPVVWEPSWRLGVSRSSSGGASIDTVLDTANKLPGSPQSFRVDFILPAGTKDFFAGIQSRKKRDLSEYKGIEFSVMGTRVGAGYLNLSTSQPDNPKLVDRFSAPFPVGLNWAVVRIPFDSMTISKLWVKRIAAMYGLLPGDQVLRLNRVEELRLGISAEHAPPGQGSIWFDNIRFYK